MSRTHKARRNLEHLLKVFQTVSDPRDRERLRDKISGARLRLAKLEANHAKRAADPDFDWREEKRRVRERI